MKCSAALTNSGSGTGTGSGTCTGSGTGSGTCTGSGTGSGTCTGSAVGSSLPSPMSNAPENASSSAFATNFWFDVSSEGSGSGVFGIIGSSTKFCEVLGSKVGGKETFPSTSAPGNGIVSTVD